MPNNFTRAGWTPFDGMSVTGWPIMTIVNGKIVMREDHLLDSNAGKSVRFEEN